MIVLDTSTLILMAKIDLLQRLADLERLVIPPGVEREATVKPDLYDARVIAEMVRDKRITVEKLTHPEKMRSVQKDFGINKGESEALLLAKEKNTAIAIDDGQGIKAAKVMNIQFMTALNIVVTLFQKKIINKETVIVKIKRLESLGRYKGQIIQHTFERTKGK